MASSISSLSEEQVLTSVVGIVATISPIEQAQALSENVELSVIHYIHIIYPLVLLVLFLGALLAHGILTSSENQTISRPPRTVTGPGGKPLPDTRSAKNTGERRPTFSFSQKLAFIWLSAGLLASFLGNGGEIVVHALSKEWWCGEATVVRIQSCFPQISTAHNCRYTSSGPLSCTPCSC
jgi:hypothetical protein